jgi:Ca2+-binding EF-hand superfamily protein
MAPGPGPAAAGAADGPPAGAADSKASGFSLVSEIPPSTAGVARPPSTSYLNSGRRQTATSEDEANKVRVAQEVNAFLHQKEGSSIRAWLKHFDLNNDLKISHNEFIRGLKKLDYPGDASQVFVALDLDHSQELSLQEIDEAGAVLWQSFRVWCVENFTGVEDFLDQIRVGHPNTSRAISRSSSARGSRLDRSDAMGATPRVSKAKTSSVNIDQELFTRSIRALGWESGFEGLLFHAMGVTDDMDSPFMSHTHLKWFDIEKRRQRRKEQARRRAAQANAVRTSSWQLGNACLADFKAFLKRNYGNYIRGWRLALSPADSMVVSKGDVFKACTNIGWRGDVRLLYKTLDKDDSGYVSIEELDPKQAKVLAHFRVFIQEKFGDAVSAFRALDKHNMKKLRQQDFCSGLRAAGYEGPSVKLLFNGLDRFNTKSINVDDIVFLDRWKTPDFLTVPPNQEAAENVKAELLTHHKTFLKAWRVLLDTDSSNRCTYSEWQEACKLMGFQGDVPGAWRALDRDYSGFITLREIAPNEAEALRVFAAWCVQEFGGVRSAFSVFDASGDNEVSYREFRRACRIYGYDTDVQKLFKALDTERNGSLAMSEVMFLDDWEFRDAQEREADSSMEEVSATADGSSVLKSTSFENASTMEYFSFAPGPGAYDLPATLGTDPRTALQNRNAGAFSFRRRVRAHRNLPGISRDAPFQPSPVDYHDTRAWSLIAPAKPSYGFGSERRAAQEPVVKTDLPGPDTYTRGAGFAGRSTRGPAANCTPRRQLKVHPLFKAGI